MYGEGFFSLILCLSFAVRPLRIKTVFWKKSSKSHTQIQLLSRDPSTCPLNANSESLLILFSFVNLLLSLLLPLSLPLLSVSLHHLLIIVGEHWVVLVCQRDEYVTGGESAGYGVLNNTEKMNTKDTQIWTDAYDVEMCMGRKIIESGHSSHLDEKEKLLALPFKF